MHFNKIKDLGALPSPLAGEGGITKLLTLLRILLTIFQIAGSFFKSCGFSLWQ